MDKNLESDQGSMRSAHIHVCMNGYIMQAELSLHLLQMHIEYRACTDVLAQRNM